MKVRGPVLTIHDKLRILKAALEDIAYGGIDIHQAMTIANSALSDAQIYKGIE